MNYSFYTKPYRHQEDAFIASAHASTYALFMDMGTGKTKVTIDSTAYLFLEQAIEFVLVVAPKAVVTNWAAEIETHLAPSIKRQVLLWNPSLTKKNKEKLRFLYTPSPELKFFLMNVEAFSTKKGVEVANSFINRFETFMVVDESTTIKNRKAKRTQALCDMGRDARFRRILTGSPITKSPLDLYSQMWFLSPELLGFRSYFAFQARYGIVQRRSMGVHSFNQVVGFQRLDELSDKLSDCSFRVRKEDCLDLPSKIYTRREVELTPEQNKAYGEMTTLALTRLKNGELATTQNILTQIMRLQQICCGHIRDDNEIIHELPSNRLNTLLATIEEVRGKVLIWGTWTRDILAIAKALRDRYGGDTLSPVAATLHGQTPPSERQGIVDTFQDPDSSLRFIVGHPKTGGYGLTLTAANTVLYYNNGYDLELRMQSEDRAHRIGQKNNVTYIDLISPGTIDEKIVKALRGKINIATAILKEDVKDWLI
jgi:SNF2 family DNA or RNA helicase